MHRVALEQNSGLGGGAEVVDVPDCVRQAVLSLTGLKQRVGESRVDFAMRVSLTERVPARMGGAQEVNEIIPFLPFSQKMITTPLSRKS